MTNPHPRNVPEWLPRAQAMSEKIFEAVARALCKANGTEPDAPSGAVGFMWRLYETDATAAIAAHIAALNEAGFVIVPREPTKEMLAAFVDGDDPAYAEDWRTMIAAALE